MPPRLHAGEVRHHRLRVEVEFEALKLAQVKQSGGQEGQAAAKALGNELLYGPKTKQEEQGLVYALVVERWAAAPGKVIKPPKDSWKPLDRTRRIRRSRPLSTRPSSAGYEYVTAAPGTEKSIGLACLSLSRRFRTAGEFRFDQWGTLVRPEQLDGRRLSRRTTALDMYWRIKLGIAPSGMPPFGGTDEQLWDVVRFLQALPYPNSLPDRVRQKVYGEGKKA